MEQLPLSKIKDIQPGDVHLHGTFHYLSGREMRLRKQQRSILTMDGLLKDDTGSVKVIWFNSRSARYIQDHIVYEVTGKVTIKNGIPQLSNPEFKLLSDGCQSILKVGPQRNIWMYPTNGKGLARDGYWAKIRDDVFQIDSHACTRCGSTLNLTVDHKIALSLGGDNELNNLTTLCKDCHELKHHRKFLEQEFDADDNYGKNYKVSSKIAKLSSALKDEHPIKIKYIDIEGKHTDRTVHPRKLLKERGCIYLEAFCELRQANRVFRVARLEFASR